MVRHFKEDNPRRQATWFLKIEGSVISGILLFLPTILDRLVLEPYKIFIMYIKTGEYSNILEIVNDHIHIAPL